MSEKIIICAMNREGIQKVLELINPDIEVIGYAVETEDNREIYRWLDNIHLNCDILREKKLEIDYRIQTLKDLLKKISDEIPKEIYIPDTMLFYLNDEVKEVTQMLEEGIQQLPQKQNLEKTICRIVAIFENILEYVYISYKLVKLYPRREIPLEQLNSYRANNIIIYHGIYWDKWIKGDNILFCREF